MNLNTKKRVMLAVEAHDHLYDMVSELFDQYCDIMQIRGGQDSIDFIVYDDKLNITASDYRTQSEDYYILPLEYLFTGPVERGELMQAEFNRLKEEQALRDKTVLANKIKFHKEELDRLLALEH